MFDFPNAPTNGQTYPASPVAGQPVWTWDGEKWTTGTTGFANVYVADSAPASAANGSFWFESDTGLLYFRYFDGNSSQWVIANPTPDTSTFVRNDVAQSFTATQQAQARSNIAAAPFDAMSWSGMQVNGSMDLSQEFGTTQTAVGSGKYVIDGWICASSGVHAAYSIQMAPSVGGFSNALQIQVNPANASPGVGDYCILRHRIEGYRVARLGWGTVNAQPVTIGFWFLANRPGTYSGSVVNYAQNRSYTFSFTISTSAAWQYVTVTIPGDTAGTWIKDNGVGLVVVIAMMAGSTFTTAPGAWTAGNFFGAPGTINGVAATSDLIQITGFTVHPGIEGPTAARSPFIMRSADQELLLCKRYFVSYGGTAYEKIGTGNAVTTTGCFVVLPLTMRAFPTLSLSAASDWSINNGAGFVTCNGISMDVFGTNTICVNFTTASALTQGAAYTIQAVATAAPRFRLDARL